MGLLPTSLSCLVLIYEGMGNDNLGAISYLGWYLNFTSDNLVTHLLKTKELDRKYTGTRGNYTGTKQELHRN